MNRTITFQSFDAIYRSNRKSSIKYWFIGTIGLLVLIIFLPWTQNIKANGDITTLRQDHRPQEINTPIAGKISSWHVKEGDYVHKGDTIVKITEIKAEYLDPNLVSRTQQQVTAKKGAIGYYEGKINTTDAQIEALRTAKKLKIEQLNNKASQLRSKLEGEQAEFTAILNEYTLAKDQYERQQKMLDVRKKYRDDFTKVVSHDRANKVFGAEDEFKSLVRKEFQKRQSEKKQIESRKKGF